MTTRKANADTPTLRVAVGRKSESIMAVGRQLQRDIELVFIEATCDHCSALEVSFKEASTIASDLAYYIKWYWVIEVRGLTNLYRGPSKESSSDNRDVIAASQDVH